MIAVEHSCHHMSTPLNKKFSENATFQRVLADALSIQDRFQAEPIYSRTGRGFLKSAGVGELQEIKKTSRKNQVSHGTD